MPPHLFPPRDRLLAPMRAAVAAADGVVGARGATRSNCSARLRRSLPRRPPRQRAGGRGRGRGPCPSRTYSTSAAATRTRTSTRCYAASPRLRGGFLLVCVGGGLAAPAERARSTASAAPAACVRSPAGRTAMLASLYAHAELLAYPSLYEGSACRSSRPWASAAPSSPPRAASCEVAGDAAVYAPPGDADALRDALESVCDDGPWPIPRRRRPREPQHFRWDCCRRGRSARARVTPHSRLPGVDILTIEARPGRV